jgi:hypothetical protein
VAAAAGAHASLVTAILRAAGRAHVHRAPAKLSRTLACSMAAIHRGVPFSSSRIQSARPFDRLNRV